MVSKPEFSFMFRTFQTGFENATVYMLMHDVRLEFDLHCLVSQCRV